MTDTTSDFWKELKSQAWTLGFGRTLELIQDKEGRVFDALHEIATSDLSQTHPFILGEVADTEGDPNNFEERSFISLLTVFVIKDMPKSLAWMVSGRPIPESAHFSLAQHSLTFSYDSTFELLFPGHIVEDRILSMDGYRLFHGAAFFNAIPFLEKHLSSHPAAMDEATNGCIFNASQPQRSTDTFRTVIRIAEENGFRWRKRMFFILSALAGEGGYPQFISELEPFLRESTVKSVCEDIAAKSSPFLSEFVGKFPGIDFSQELFLGAAAGGDKKTFSEMKNTLIDKYTGWRRAVRILKRTELLIKAIDTAFDNDRGNIVDIILRENGKTFSKKFLHSLLAKQGDNMMARSVLEKFLLGKPDSATTPTAGSRKSL